MSRAPRRAFWVAVVVSLALHGLTGWSLSRDRLPVVAQAPPPAPPPPPPRVDFKLVETPESARVEDEEPDTPFVSDRNTRSQDDAAHGAVTERPRARTDGPGLEQRVQARAPRPSPRVETPRPVTPATPPTPPTPPTPQPQRTEERREPTDRADRKSVELPSREPEPTPPTPRPTPPRPPVDAGAPAVAPQVAPGNPGYSESERAELERAVARGEFSYEATQHFFADYFLAMRREVEVTWNLMLSTRYWDLKVSQAVVDFLVLPDGSLGAVEVRGARGDELFPNVCVGAIRRSAPFGPVPYDPRLPAETRDLPLRMRYTFNLQDR